MTRDELDTLVEWAALEGWNPGSNDADLFWATDRDGFIAAAIDGELIGRGSIVAYEKKYGFMGVLHHSPGIPRTRIGRSPVARAQEAFVGTP